MTLALIAYLGVVVFYVWLSAEISNLDITLDIDREYARKANHAAEYGSVADWNEIMDARLYFWEARR